MRVAWKAIKAAVEGSMRNFLILPAAIAAMALPARGYTVPPDPPHYPVSRSDADFFAARLVGSLGDPDFVPVEKYVLSSDAEYDAAVALRRRAHSVLGDWQWGRSNAEDGMVAFLNECNARQSAGVYARGFQCYLAKLRHAMLRRVFYISSSSPGSSSAEARDNATNLLARIDLSDSERVHCKGILLGRSAWGAPTLGNIVIVDRKSGACNGEDPSAMLGQLRRQIHDAAGDAAKYRMAMPKVMDGLYAWFSREDTRKLDAGVAESYVGLLADAPDAGAMWLLCCLSEAFGHLGRFHEFLAHIAGSQAMDRVTVRIEFVSNGKPTDKIISAKGVIADLINNAPPPVKDVVVDVIL